MIADDTERSIAWYIARYYTDKWKADAKTEISDEGRVRSVNLIWTPDESAINDEGYVGIDFVSRIFSAAYNLATLDRDRRLRELRYEPDGWLVALTSGKTGDLPVRKTRIWPSLGPISRSSADFFPSDT